MKKLILFGGKGGTGKTTLTAATSTLISEEYETLVISFDVAHSLSDVFGVPIGPKTRRLKRNLFAIEPDTEEVAEKSSKVLLGSFKNMLTSTKVDKIFPEIGEMISFLDPRFLPLSIKNSMFFEYILENEGRYDVILADFPPTASMFALLEIPEIHLTKVLGKGIKTKKRPVLYYQVLSRILSPSRVLGSPSSLFRERFIKEAKALSQRAEKILKHLSEASLRLVTLAEKASVNETLRSAELSQDFTNLDAIYINRVITDKIAESQFLKRKKQLQDKYIEELRNRFQDKMIVQIPDLGFEPCNLKSLEKLSQMIYDDIPINDIIF
ncbi:MAG: ArsA family ATPase [Candidatus Hodarchaeota archaeon]